MKSVAAIALVGAIVVCQMAAPANAEDAKRKTYYFKRGTSQALWKADVKSCADQVKKDYIQPALAKLNIPYQPGLAGAAVTGFARGWEQGKIKREAVSRISSCMLKKKGYRRVTMTPRQEEIWNGLSHEQRLQAEAILAGGGNIAVLLSN